MLGRPVWMELPRELLNHFREVYTYIIAFNQNWARKYVQNTIEIHNVSPTLRIDLRQCRCCVGISVRLKWLTDRYFMCKMPIERSNCRAYVESNRYVYILMGLHDRKMFYTFTCLVVCCQTQRLTTLF